MINLLPKSLQILLQVPILNQLMMAKISYGFTLFFIVMSAFAY